LPVVTYVDPDTEVAAAAATREGCRYLPRSAGEGTFRTAVTDALATYGRRRWEAADSDILELLFETADMTLFAKDDRGRYLKTNQSVAEPDHSDVIGQTDREVFGGLNPRMAQAAYRDDLAVVETGEPIENKREKFGNEHWSEVTKVPWRADGETLGLVGIAQHVTSEVKLKQKLAEQNRRFDQFASYVSHDLRTPLQIAVGALDRARAGDEEALDKLENAHDRIADLRRLADDGSVEVYRDGDYKRLYPAGRFTDFEKRALGYLRRETPRGMLVELLRTPEATGSHLADGLGVSRPTVSKYAGELDDAGLLSREDGYRVERPETVLMLVVRYADSFDESAAGLAAEADSLVRFDG